MQVVQIAGYQYATESCYICHSPGPGVDTEVFIEGEGVLFLCFNCIRALYAVAGLEDHEAANVEIEQLSALVTRLEQQGRRERQAEDSARSQVRPLKAEIRELKATIAELTAPPADE